MHSREFKEYHVTLVGAGMSMASGKIQASAPCKAVELFMNDRKLLIPTEAIVRCDSGLMFSFLVGVANNSKDMN